ncbi:MAG: NADH-quinone oxidoreductase subunit C [Rubrivivax sp.]|nr:NADH-quinone oxidoreductase subunit C [Rubrivivax sp.]
MTDDTLTKALAPLIDRSWDSFGMPVLELQVVSLMTVVQRLRTEFGFTLFLDVTAVDHPQRQPRFDVVYHFMSARQRSRIRLKLQVGEQAPVVPTLTGLFGSARYMEREVHDMYGIRFEGNADLRPILLYEGFVGHPLRKDYPMEQEQPIVPYRK